MSDPTLIITGASRGLGTAVARIAAQLGAAVVLGARTESVLHAVALSITAAGGQALAVPADVADPADCQRLVARTLARFGRIDALVNNAAMLEPVSRLDTVEAGAWEHLMRVNVTGPLQLTQAALPALRDSGGRVINVSSGAAIHPKAGWGAYCTSKAALNTLTSVLAVEEPAITVLAVRPGIIDTAMQAAIRAQGVGVMSEADYARFVGHYTAGELLPPEQPGRALAVLALHAPHEWSGEFIQWNEARVEALVARRFPGQA
ncbi:MAG: SDR family NAD(P)-dependent oxidoreductase [Anaerolineae bacterium]|nr:SDR family NAD(P)-dependent oxidoreductase [Anaerolineae bacterium]